MMKWAALSLITVALVGCQTVPDPYTLRAQDPRWNEQSVDVVALTTTFQENGQWVTATGATVCPAKSSDYYIYMPEVKVGAVNCLMITPKTRHVQVNLSNGQSEEWRVRRDAPVGGCPWFMRPNGMKVVLPYWCKACP